MGWADKRVHKPRMEPDGRLLYYKRTLLYIVVCFKSDSRLSRLYDAVAVLERRLVTIARTLPVML